MFFFQVLLPTLLVDSKFQCRNKISFKSRPIGTRIYGDLVYKFNNIMSRTDFSVQFQKVIISPKRIGYDLNVMR